MSTSHAALAVFVLLLAKSSRAAETNTAERPAEWTKPFSLALAFLASALACLAHGGTNTGTDSWQHVLAADGLAYHAIVPGVEYASVDYAGKPRPLAYHVVKVDLSDEAVSLGAMRSQMAENGDMAADTLTNMVSLSLNQRPGYKIVAAINADYFGKRPLGIHIQNGDPINFPNKRSAFLVEQFGKPVISPITMQVQLRFGEAGPKNPVTSLNNCALNKGSPDTVNLPSGWQRFTLREGEAVVAELTGRAPERIGALIETRLSSGMTITNPGNHLLIWSTHKEWTSCMRTGEIVSLRMETQPAAVEAVGGGPRLVREGRPSLEYEAEGWTPVEAAKLKGLNPRSATGISRNGKTVFLVVVEGRKATSQGLDAAELAQLLVNLGCWDAMNHDGGGSASLYTLEKFVTTQAQPRPIKNGLAVFRRDSR
jgi:hypothetical protein